jgi:hypothetical protein
MPDATVTPLPLYSRQVGFIQAYDVDFTTGDQATIIHSMGTDTPIVSLIALTLGAVEIPAFDFVDVNTLIVSVPGRAPNGVYRIYLISGL